MAKKAAKKPRASTPRARTAKKATARSVEGKADLRLIERTLALIAAQEEASGAGRRAIGEHLLDEYFGGDAALVRSKSPLKAKSYALLAKRAPSESGWTEADLRKAVTIAIVYRSLPGAFRDLVPSYYLERLGSIDDEPARIALAKRIASSELRGKKADDAIAKAGTTERAGGRARKPAALKAIDALLRAGERAKGEVTQAKLRTLDDETRQDLRARATALRKQLDALLEILDRK